MNTPKSDQPESASELPENIKRLQESLLSEEARLKQAMTSVDKWYLLRVITTYLIKLNMMPF